MVYKKVIQDIIGFKKPENAMNAEDYIEKLYHLNRESIDEAFSLVDIGEDRSVKARIQRLKNIIGEQIISTYKIKAPEDTIKYITDEGDVKYDLNKYSLRTISRMADAVSRTEAYLDKQERAVINMLSGMQGFMYSTSKSHRSALTRFKQLIGKKTFTREDLSTNFRYLGNKTYAYDDATHHYRISINDSPFGITITDMTVVGTDLDYVSQEVFVPKKYF